MQNIYNSNTVKFNKKKTQPKSIEFIYCNADRLNNFHASPKNIRRQVSETYRAGDRNHKIPTTSSPVMMTSGVSPQQYQTE